MEHWGAVRGVKGVFMACYGHMRRGSKGLGGVQGVFRA